MTMSEPMSYDRLVAALREATFSFSPTGPHWYAAAAKAIVEADQRLSQPPDPATYHASPNHLRSQCVVCTPSLADQPLVYPPTPEYPDGVIAEEPPDPATALPTKCALCGGPHLSADVHSYEELRAFEEEVAARKRHENVVRELWTADPNEKVADFRERSMLRTEHE